MKFHRFPIAAAALAACFLAACSQKPAVTAEAPEPAAPSAPTLPVSLNAMMVALIDHSADEIYTVSNGKVPKTDAEWRDIEYHAYQLVVGGKVMQLAGTGPKDAGWVADPEWIKQSDALSEAGMEALKAAQAKDPAPFKALGDKISDTCLMCHTKFKGSEVGAALPTGGIVHEPAFSEKK